MKNQIQKVNTLVEEKALRLAAEQASQFDELVKRLVQIKDPSQENFYVAVNPNKFIENSLAKYYTELLHFDLNMDRGRIVIVAHVRDVIWYSSNDKGHIGINSTYYYPKFVVGVADMYDSINGALKGGKRLFIEVIR